MKHQYRRELNIYISESQYEQIATMSRAGLSMSAVARLAIRKHSELPEPEDLISPKAKRIMLYIDNTDAELLESLAATHGISRSETLRRLITHYLSSNAESIANLF